MCQAGAVLDVGCGGEHGHESKNDTNKSEMSTEIDRYHK